MEDLLGGDIWHVINLLLLISYILIKELLLDRKKLKKDLDEAKHQKGPLEAFKIDLTTLKTKVINLEDAIEKQSETLTDKLDVILADFREKHDENKSGLKEISRTIDGISQRLTAVETELKLKRRRQ